MAAVRLRLQLGPGRFFVSEPVPVSLIRETGGFFAAIDDLSADEITVELDTLLGLEGISTDWLSAEKLTQILVFIFGLPWTSRSYEAWTGADERPVLDALVTALKTGGRLADTLSKLGGLELQALASMLAEHGTPIWTCLRRSHVCQIVAGLYWDQFGFEERNRIERAEAVRRSSSSSSRSREMWEHGISYAMLAETVCKKEPSPSVVTLATDLLDFLIRDRQEDALVFYRTLSSHTLKMIALVSLDVEAVDNVRWIQRELPGQLTEKDIEAFIFRSLAQPAHWDLTVDLIQTAPNIAAIVTGDWFKSPWVMSPDVLERLMMFLWNDDSTKMIVLGLDLTWGKVLHKALDALSNRVFIEGPANDCDDDDSLFVPVYRGSAYDKSLPKRTDLDCAANLDRDNFRRCGVSIRDAKKRIFDCVEVIAGLSTRDDIMSAVRLCFDKDGLGEPLFRIVKGAARINRDWTDHGLRREFLDYERARGDDLWFVAWALRAMYDNTDGEAAKRTFATGIPRVIADTTYLCDKFTSVIGHVFRDVNFGPFHNFEIVAEALEPWPRQRAGTMCLNFFNFARQLDEFQGEPWCTMVSRVYARCYAAKQEIEHEAEVTGIPAVLASRYTNIKECLERIGWTRRATTKPTMSIPEALRDYCTAGGAGAGGPAAGGAAAGGAGGGGGAANPYSAAMFRIR